MLNRRSRSNISPAAVDRRRWFVGLLAVATVVVLGGVVRAADAPAPKTRAEALAMIHQAEAEARDKQVAALAEDLTPLEKEFGIKILSIRRTAAGYSLDLRYQVVDAEKAAMVLYRRWNPNPHVIVEKSGAKLGVPFTAKAGFLRSSVSAPDQVKKGRIYTALFANPSRHVEVGDKVTLAMGAFQVEHLKVE